MKKNNIDFSAPRRQSYIAIILIIYKSYKIIIRQVWPIFILYFFNKKDGPSPWFYGLIGLAVIATIVSIIRYFKFYFYLNKDELIVDSGVLRKNRLTVPFERIQTINFEQTIIHRIFNVVELEIDTAGSSKSEFNFDALDMSTAESLRDILIKAKKEATDSIDATIVEEEVNPRYETILTLDIPDLIKAGMVENHLRSGGLVLAGLFWVWQSLENIGYEDQIEDRVQSWADSLALLGIVLLLFFIISFSVSMVRMVVTNYNLKFMRSHNGFKLNAGLFTKKDTSALDNKIQLITWADNPLKKLIGIKDLYLKQASSREVSNKKSIKVPGTNSSHIEKVVNTLYGRDHHVENYNQVHPSYWVRGALYTSIIILPIIGFMIYCHTYTPATIFFFIWSYICISRYLKYRKLRYGFSDKILSIKGGAFGDKSTILPIYKIQSISRSQSPYQRRNDLASIQVFTASGSIAIPYIPLDKSSQLMNYLTFKVEDSHIPWM